MTVRVNRARHGRSRYQSGCRCDECRAANNEYARKRYRARRGVKRRLIVGLLRRVGLA